MHSINELIIQGVKLGCSFSIKNDAHSLFSNVNIHKNLKTKCDATTHNRLLHYNIFHENVNYTLQAFAEYVGFRGYNPNDQLQLIELNHTRDFF